LWEAFGQGGACILNLAIKTRLGYERPGICILVKQQANRLGDENIQELAFLLFRAEVTDESFGCG